MKTTTFVWMGLMIGQLIALVGCNDAGAAAIPQKNEGTFMATSPPPYVPIVMDLGEKEWRVSNAAGDIEVKYFLHDVYSIYKH